MYTHMISNVYVAGIRKPLRVPAVASESIERSGAPDSVWLEYAYHKHHPVLQYLPTKLAEWIEENMQDELGFPDKVDPDKWSVSELNNILQKHVVPGRNGCALHTFGCLEWESERTEESRDPAVTPSKCQSVSFTI